MTTHDELLLRILYDRRLRPGMTDGPPHRGGYCNRTDGRRELNELISPDNFDFFARFCRGWIIITVRSRFVVGEKPKLAEMVVEAVILSLVNQLIFLMLSSAALCGQSLACLASDAAEGYSSS